MDTYKEHERAHHPKVEEVRNIKTAVAQAELLETDRMVRVFLLVYWLASEALPMLKIYTLARLISLLQFRNAANYVLNVGSNYVNHMTAKDMTMYSAHQLTRLPKNATGGPGVPVPSLSGRHWPGRDGHREGEWSGGRGGGEQSRGKPRSSSGPFSSCCWGYSAFQYSWYDEPPQRIPARAASQRLPRPFGPRQ